MFQDGSESVDSYLAKQNRSKHNINFVVHTPMTTLMCITLGVQRAETLEA